MRFVGVTLEFLQSRETDAVGSLTRSLARFDIQDSEFSFESRSNQCKTVDFTNHAVIGYDTRYEGERRAFMCPWYIVCVCKYVLCVSNVCVSKSLKIHMYM